jgi:EXLDI family protein
METITLSRDGLRPLRFQGRQLASSEGGWRNGKEYNRYYTLTVYETADQQYVAHVHYQTRWQGEQDHATVFQSSTLAGVVTDLEDFDPCVWVEGYKALLSRHVDPAPQGYRQRQQALEQQIRSQYAAQVSALCADLDIAETL